MIKPSQCLYCYKTVSFNVIFPISWKFFLLIMISYNILFLSFLCNITISTYVLVQSGSVQFSCSVMYNSLWPRGLHHARPPCPSSTLGVYPNSFPLSQWCQPIISSFVVPFASCLQSFPASGSFLISLSHQVANVLEFQLQHQSLQGILRTDLL